MKVKLLIIQLFALLCIPSGAQVVDAGSIEGKWVCGYQGWFNALGDGSPMNRWGHWGKVKSTESEINLRPTFDVYPAIDEYADADLYETDFNNLGDGRKAKLFSSYNQGVIEKHFEWMQTYGIDGVALQRFIGPVLGHQDIKQNRDSIASKVRHAAEKYGRIFYMMYDISGLKAHQFDAMLSDWQTVFEEQLDITSSSQYAHQDGKPVICIWGFGFNNKDGNQQQCLNVINWFKNKGYFVIGGVPTFWRTSDHDSKPNFNIVYDAYDMISPWSVGRFKDTIGADDFLAHHIIPDKIYCDSAGIAYQPVIFPGFSWYNLKKSDYSKNQIPRIQGKFFWRQYYNLQWAGIENFYSAMFDEYDEATNYMKAADSYYDVPSDRYFLTNSSDGKYVSSDFYLRILGAANASRFLNKPVNKTHNIPLSIAPLYYRSSFEPGFDALPIHQDSLVFGPSKEAHRIGKHALKVIVKNKNAVSNYVLADVHFQVIEHTFLKFFLMPKSKLGEHIALDIVCTDGSRLSDFMKKEFRAQKGNLNEWTEFTFDVSKYLLGKTVDKVLVVCGLPIETDKVMAFIDDVAIYTNVK